MDYKQKFKDFNKRWNIPDSTEQEEFQKFKNRILNVFYNIDNYIDSKDNDKICMILGITTTWEDFGGIVERSDIVDAIKQSSKYTDLYLILELIFSVPIQGGYSKSHKSRFLKELQEAMQFSIHATLVKTKDNNIIFYPQGENEFDEKLVNDVLIFLNAESQTHFIAALKFYQQNTVQSRIKSVESIRRSLEEFMRYKLKNTKGLDNNIKDLGIQLKSDGRDTQLRTIITQTFSYIDKYFNENSKHKDGDINEAENEYIIYQAGVLMRYIHKSIY